MSDSSRDLPVLVRRRPFRTVLLCGHCKTVHAWQIDPKTWMTSQRLFWISVLLPLLPFITVMQPPGSPGLSEDFCPKPEFALCPSCGRPEPFVEEIACWISESSWWSPWRWGRGRWMFRSEFDELVRGQGQAGKGALSLVSDAEGVPAPAPAGAGSGLPAAAP